MAESVECAECGTRYDSMESAFCPRCGSTRHGQPMADAVASSQRAHPRRRRVQSGGVVLVAVGGFLLVVFVTALFQAATFVEQSEAFWTDQQGGAVVVAVTHEGSPVANATVRLLHPDGGVLDENRTDGAGRAALSARRSALAEVSVQPPEGAGNGTWNRSVVALPGARVDVALDLARDPQRQDERVGERELVSTVRVVAAAFCAMSLVVVAGGVAALRLRARPLAYAGALMGFVPALVFTVVTLAVGALLFLLLMGAALGLIVQGRREFGRERGR